VGFSCGHNFLTLLSGDRYFWKFTVGYRYQVGGALTQRIIQTKKAKASNTLS